MPANCDTIAGPLNTDIITDVMFKFLVLPNNNENVIQKITPAIQLKNTLRTPILNRVVGKEVDAGGRGIVEGIVQNTKVVPKIANIVELLEGVEFTLFKSCFLFKNIL